MSASKRNPEPPSPSPVYLEPGLAPVPPRVLATWAWMAERLREIALREAVEGVAAD